MTQAETIFLTVSWNCVFNILLHENRLSSRSELSQWLRTRLWARLLMLVPPVAIIVAPTVWVENFIINRKK